MDDLDENTKKKKKTWEECMVKFDVINWYDKLKEHTFESQFLKFTGKEKKAIVSAFGSSSKKKKVVDSETEKVLVEFTNKVDKSISSLGDCSKEGVFVRISSRSPKDAVFEESSKSFVRFKNLLFKRLKALYSTSPALLKDQKKLSSEEFNVLFETNIESLRVFSGDEVVDLLVNSERVCSDLRIFSEFSEFDVFLIIRRWSKDLKYKNEFRGYVSKNQLNGLSQYNQFCFYKDILDTKKDIATKICQFFKTQIQKKLVEYENYVIDFALVGKEVIVIELNTFKSQDKDVIVYLYYQLGPSFCCFSSEDEIKKLGTGPFSMKVNEKFDFDLVKKEVPDFLFANAFKIKSVLREKEKAKKCLIS